MGCLARYSLGTFLASLNAISKMFSNLLSLVRE